LQNIKISCQDIVNVGSNQSRAQTRGIFYIDNIEKLLQITILAHRIPGLKKVRFIEATQYKIRKDLYETC
jgi:hypothetical protein